MRITVEVSGWLKKFAKGKPLWELDLQNQGLCALDVINMIGIPREEIGFIIVKNLGSDKERPVADSYPVSDGDRLRLYAMIIGG